MEVDYYKKYLELKNLNKKQEGVITKLQNQIRERCQSYLLYSSRQKKGFLSGENEMSPKKGLNSNKKEDYTSMSESKVETYSGKLNHKDSFESSIQLNSSDLKLAYSRKFLIRSQFSIVQKGIKQEQTNKQTLQEELKFKNQLIEDNKGRLLKVQQQKNQYVKEIEKINLSLNQAVNRANDYERKLEIVTKAEKKLKSRVAKITEFEEEVDQLYEELNKTGLKKQSEQENNNIETKSKIDWVLKQLKRGASKQNFESERIQTSNNSEKANSIKIDNKVSEIDKIVIVGLQKQKIELLSKLEKQKENFNIQIEKLTKRYELQIKQLKDSSRQQSLLISDKEKEGHEKELLKGKCNRLEKQIQQKDKTISRMNTELLNARELLKKCKEQLNQSYGQLTKQKEELKTSRILQSNYDKTVGELQKSRSIIDVLENSRVSKDQSQFKQSLSQSEKKDLDYSSMKVEQPLEEPYYVEEELYHDPTDQYVKRSFIRKKIVKRNFSASAYRVASNSKDETNSMNSSRLRDFNERSLDKKQRLKENLKDKKEQFKFVLPNPRISEISEQNRESDYMKNEREVVRVIEVETRTPTGTVRTSRISSKGR